jgi:hypothetical protein
MLASPAKQRRKAPHPEPNDGRRLEHQAGDVVIGILVAPKIARDVSTRLGSELAQDLQRRYGTVEWRTHVVIDRLVAPPAAITEIFDAARRKLLEFDWDLGIVVTDLPVRVGGRPVAEHVSPTHGIAVVSVPALGALNLRHRFRRTMVNVVSDLVGAADEQPRGRDALARMRRHWEQELLRELATDTAESPRGLRLLFVPGVLAGNLRLLVGMVRANRPWRFAVRLYGALVAALAVSAFGLVTSDVWRLAGAHDWWRLTTMSFTSILATVFAVIAVHGLWERAPDPRVREQVVLFNVATAATVTVGIFCLYLALFALTFAGAGLVIAPSLLERALNREIGVTDYAIVAWFITSFATIGGALGAGLESDEAVREAAYVSSEPDREQAE